MENHERPSEQLRQAEEYMKAQKELEQCLRQAYVSLAGAQLSLRKENIWLTPASWPQQGHVLCDTDVQGDDDDRLLRTWTAGIRPPQDMLDAKRLFRQAIVIAVKLSALKNRKA